MGDWMNGFVSRLEKVEEENQLSGGVEKIKQQHALGKLTLRERIDLLADDGSFCEWGGLVRELKPSRISGEETPGSACDGIIMGVCRIGGREVAVYGTDFTVMAGTIGNQGAWKIADFVSWAGKMQIPLMALFDSAGERYTLKRGDVGYDGFTQAIRNHSLNSGLIPQIALVLGPCTGLLAYAASLCNFLIMNKKTGFLSLGATLDNFRAGAANMHMETSGQCDIIANNDTDAIRTAKTLLTFMPQNCWQKTTQLPCEDPVDRTEEELLDIMPEDPRHTYDVHDIIDLIVDDGEFFELKEDYALHLVIGFARLNGETVGIVANNPDELSGVLEPDSSDKYDRFMSFLDAFNIPLITMVDTSGFVPGDKWEQKGILRHGAKLLHTYTRLTIPKITLQLRRSYGGGNIVMGARGMGPDIIIAWPTAEYAPTGAETVLQAVFNKELAKAKEEGNYDEVHDALLTKLQNQFSVMTCAKFWTNLYTSHIVINPKTSRSVLIRALEQLRNKKFELPCNKRAIKPA